MALLGQVNADLVGPPGLQANATEGGRREGLDDLDLGDRGLALVGPPGAAPQSVAAILDQARFETPRPHPPVGHGEVLALGQVLLEDAVQPALGQLGLGETD